MAETNETAVADSPSKVESAAPAPEAKVSPTPEVSPAQDLKEIQNLLVCGIFPGQMAPSVVKAYSLLQKMVENIESQNKK
jgi:hypothetical protein